MEEICADPKAFEQNVNQNVRRNGERVWISWTNRIVYDELGHVVEILSVGTDITEQSGGPTRHCCGEARSSSGYDHGKPRRPRWRCSTGTDIAFTTARPIRGFWEIRKICWGHRHLSKFTRMTAARVRGSV